MNIAIKSFLLPYTKQLIVCDQSVCCNDILIRSSLCIKAVLLIVHVCVRAGLAGSGGGADPYPGPDGEECQHERTAGQRQRLSKQLPAPSQGSAP